MTRRAAVLVLGVLAAGSWAWAAAPLVRPAHSPPPRTTTTPPPAPEPVPVPTTPLPLPALPPASTWVTALPGDALPAARIYAPRQPRDGRPWMLLLHGWNQHARDWDALTTVEDLAERDGVVLVAPDLGTTVYLRQRYADTPPNAADEPGLANVERIVRWAETTFGLAAAPANRAVLGVSTGGRGAALLGAEGWFGTVIALSGTYDLSSLVAGSGEYRIHAAVLGPRAAHPARWAAEDVAQARARATLPSAARWYLAHAANDPYVPSSQTSAFEQTLRGAGIQDVRVHIAPGAHHDWATWDAWLREALPPAGG